MSRSARSKDNAMIAQARRLRALERPEFREPSEPRRSADGATSFPVKAVDGETSRLVEEFLAKRGRG